MKKINRLDFLNKIQQILGISLNFEKYNNIYTYSNGDEFFTQIEFISETALYPYTIYINSIIDISKQVHTELCDYIKSLKLNRQIILDTCTDTTLINS